MDLERVHAEAGGAMLDGILSREEEPLQVQLVEESRLLELLCHHCPRVRQCQLQYRSTRQL